MLLGDFQSKKSSKAKGCEVTYITLVPPEPHVFIFGTSLLPLLHPSKPLVRMELSEILMLPQRRMKLRVGKSYEGSGQKKNTRR